MLYSVLCLNGNYSCEELQNFRQWDSPTPGHLEIDLNRAIENTSGPLGQGHAFAAVRLLLPSSSRHAWVMG